MERTKQKALNSATVGIIVSIFLSFIAKADVIFRSPAAQTEPSQLGENYPDSQFGSQPAPVSVDSQKSVASEALSGEPDDRDEENEYSSKFHRNPAGLTFSKKQGQPQPQSVIEDRSMPRSAANVNPLPQMAASRTGTQEVSIIVSELGFFPKMIFVTRDIPVRMYVTSSSKKTLCIMMDTFQVRRQIRSLKIEEINFTPSVPGKFRFYCPVNGIEGTLLVKELSSSTFSGNLHSGKNSREGQ